MEMPYQAFRCGLIRSSVAQQISYLDRAIFGMRNLKTKAVPDQQVDA
jgi:hypothetical protein